MSKRSDRSEAARLNRKLAFQEVGISSAQLAANRANSQLSTGPVTPAGQAASSLNALKTGLTGRTVLLPGDDTAEYSSRLENATAHHRPVTDEEKSLVQSLVDIDWRLDRAVMLETGIYAKGAAEFADRFDDQPVAHRKLLIQTETYLKYEKSLRNLNVQEARLQRQRTKNLAELKRLKEERIRYELMLQSAARSARPAASVENGFEFSIPDCTPESEPGFNTRSAVTA